MLSDEEDLFEESENKKLPLEKFIKSSNTE